MKVEGGKGRQPRAFEFVDIGAGIVPGEHQHGQAVARRNGAPIMITKTKERGLSGEVMRRERLGAIDFE